ncbi:hypothetical protein GCM10010191_68010 [Actinomadura vinacea]|uniref:DUF397 domain-containing protein n=1 Tax=Actinomadura vinacea TaxID=115336 RepID=A0ABP5X125_9ACTN
MSSPEWRKSSRSTGGTGGECVELARLGKNDVGIRDSRAPETGHVTLKPRAFALLVNQVKVGELDL